MTGETEAEQGTIGRMPGRVHRATRCRSGHGFPLWLRLDRESLDLEPWLRPAVTEALAAYDETPGLDWAGLHTDPAPEAFFASPGRSPVWSTGRARFPDPCCTTSPPP